MTAPAPTIVELKPCPFCGGTTNIHLEKAIYGYGHSLECETCGAFMSSDAEPPDDSAKIVREAWNRRASSLSPQAAPAGAAEALRAAYMAGYRRANDCAPYPSASDFSEVGWCEYSASALATPPSSGQRVDAPLAANPAQGVSK